MVPYAWIAGEFGTVDVKGHTFKLDTTLYDVFSLLADGDALGGAGYFGARYGRWACSWTRSGRSSVTRA